MPIELHPTRPSKSRQLWDDGRKPNASFLQKIAPYIYETGLLDLYHAMTLDSLKQNSLTIVSVFVQIESLWREHRRSITKFLKRLKRHYKLFFSILLYLLLTVQLHLRYECGQMILIFTSLVLIYTHGFEKNDAKGKNRPVSAYSVFNGFKNLLGSIDAEELGRQYAGGAMAALNQPRDEQVDDFDDEDGEEEEEALPDADEHEPVQQPRRRGKKKQKGRREEIEMRREKQYQLQMAREREGF